MRSPLAPSGTLLHTWQIVGSMRHCCVLPNLAQDLVLNLFAPYKPVHHALVSGAAKLHNDVVNSCRDLGARIVRQQKRVSLLVAVGITESDHVVGPECVENRRIGSTGTAGVGGR